MSDERIVWKLIQYWGCVSCYFIKRLSETELFHHSDLGAWQNTKIVMGVERWGATDAKCIGLEWSNDIQWHDSDEGKESEARLGTFQYWMMTRPMGTSSGKAIGTDLCMKHAEIVAWAKMLSCATRHTTRMSAGNWKPDWAPSNAEWWPDQWVNHQVKL
jgi:hypothetical protein